MLQSEWHTWLQVEHGSIIKSDNMQIPFKFLANLKKASLIYIMDGISKDTNFLLLRCHLLWISNEEYNVCRKLSF